MLIDLFDPEAERRGREKTGTGSACEEFVQVKTNFVFAGLDSRAADDWVIELAIGAEPAFGELCWRGFDAPYLDTQTLGRTPARDIDSMNGYSARHLLSSPLIRCPLGLSA